MKIIQVQENKVIDIINAREDATLESLLVVSEIPEYEQKEGYSGVLMYSEEKGLHWDYVENQPIEEATENEYKQAYEIVVGKKEVNL